MFLKLHDISTLRPWSASYSLKKSTSHVVFSVAGTAQEAGADGRSGAAGIPVHGSLISSSLEGKHHVAKTSS